MRFGVGGFELLICQLAVADLIGHIPGLILSSYLGPGHPDPGPLGRDTPPF